MVPITENIIFCRLCAWNPASGLLQIGQKSEKWQWCHNFSTWRQRQFFLDCFVSPAKFSYWSKFHVKIITGSGIMTIFFYKWLTEIGNSASEFVPISRDWGKLWARHLAGMSLIQCYWMLQNSRVTTFTVLELLRENQLGRDGKITSSPLPPRLGLKRWTTIEVLKKFQIRLTNLAEFEKCRAIRASVGGMGGVLAWVVC